MGAVGGGGIVKRAKLAGTTVLQSDTNEGKH